MVTSYNSASVAPNGTFNGALGNYLINAVPLLSSDPLFGYDNYTINLTAKAGNVVTIGSSARTDINISGRGSDTLNLGSSVNVITTAAAVNVKALLTDFRGINSITLGLGSVNEIVSAGRNNWITSSGSSNDIYFTNPANDSYTVNNRFDGYLNSSDNIFSAGGSIRLNLESGTDNVTIANSTHTTINGIDGNKTIFANSGIGSSYFSSINITGKGTNHISIGTGDFLINPGVSSSYVNCGGGEQDIVLNPSLGGLSKLYLTNFGSTDQVQFAQSGFVSKFKITDADTASWFDQGNHLKSDYFALGKTNTTNHAQFLFDASTGNLAFSKDSKSSVTVMGNISLESGATFSASNISAFGGF